MSAPADIVAPCPLRERFAIEALVLGNDSQPVANVAIRLERDAQSVLGSVSGGDGLVRFDGLLAGSYTLTLPELDAEAWRPLPEVALAADKAKSEGDAPWGPPAPPAHPPKNPWTIEPGDCLASIAHAAGLAKDTIWNFAGNASLAAERSTGYDLRTGDVLQIPPIKLKRIHASTGNRYPVTLVDVPERLKVRFLYVNGKPKANEPFLVELEAPSRTPPSQTGTTDGSGGIDVPIPPDATAATVLLGKKPNVVEYQFRLGEMNPPADLVGARRRLVNLGFLQEVSDEAELEAATRDALIRFQERVSIQVTGELDGATKAKLKETFLS